MERAAVSVTEPQAVLFRDGLGERHQTADPTGHETLEVLWVRGELSAVPSFEFALRERVSRLANVRHPSLRRVKSVERLSDPDQTLAITSESGPGIRLSHLLAEAEAKEIPIDIGTALGLFRQLLPAVALLHENARDGAHGALGPERVVITPQARLVVVEYVFGSALEQLRFSHERYWTELRVPLPRSAGLPRFDQRADVLQAGMVALALILGRPLKDDEFPSRLAEVVASTWAVSARGGFEPLPPGLRAWLGRALQLDSRNAFATAADAIAELDKVPGDSVIATAADLQAFLSKFSAFEKPAQKITSITPITPNLPAAPAPAPPQMPALPMPPRPAAIVAPPRVLIEPEPQPPKRRTSTRRLPLKVAIAGGAVAAVAALLAGGFLAAHRFAPPVHAATTGTLVVTTNPAGAQAAVDGEVRGTTPITLSLPAGAHTLELRGGGDPRSIPVTITAGSRIDQYIELPKSSPTAGQLQVRTDPPGAQVSVDGVPRGTSPTLISDLAPGDHTVLLTSDLGSVKHSVTVEPGTTASIMVPLAAPDGAPVSAWVSLSAPIELQLYEHDRLVGSSASDRIMVAAGHHDFDVVNTALGFRASRSVQVAAGKVAPLKIDVPTGVIALNATPWAEVWIDGEKVGETPIGNLPVLIGSHDVLFRNPDLGEQHYKALVTLKEPSRISIDMRKK